MQRLQPWFAVLFYLSGGKSFRLEWSPYKCACVYASGLASMNLANLEKVASVAHAGSGHDLLYLMKHLNKISVALLEVAAVGAVAHLAQRVFAYQVSMALELTLASGV